MAGVLSFLGLAAVALAVYSQTIGDGVTVSDQPSIPTEEATTVKMSTPKLATTTQKSTPMPVTTTERPKPPPNCYTNYIDKLRYYTTFEEAYDYIDARILETEALLAKQHHKCVEVPLPWREPLKTCVEASFTAIQKWVDQRHIAWYDLDPQLSLLVGFFKQVLAMAIPFVIGVIGNSLVLFTIFSYMKTRTVTNILLAALATTDLLTLLVAVPVKIFQKLKPQDLRLGVIGCPAVYYVQWLFYHASIYTLVVIALERFLTICYPLKSKTVSTPGAIKVILVFVWILSFVMSIPGALFYVDYQYNAAANPCREVFACGDHAMAQKALVEYYTEQNDGNRTIGTEAAERIQYITIGFIIFNYVIPLTAMVCAYGAVSVSLIKSIKAGRAMKAAASNEHGKAKVEDDADAKKRFKIVKMLIMVVVCFALFWAPYIVWNVLFIIPVEFYSDSFVQYLAWNDSRNFEVGLSTIYGLSYANSCVNPFIYLFMSKSFRDGFLYAIGCRKGRDPRMSSTSSKQTLSTRAASSAGNSSAQA